MSDQSFHQEIERLSSISFRKKSGKETKIASSNNLFETPAFVTSYNYSGLFEYAVVETSTNTIRYIFLEQVASYDDIVFPEKYWPKKPLKKTDLRAFSDGKSTFSIYY